MRYTDYESYWQWMAIEMPMERGEGTVEVEDNEPLSSREQWMAIEMPMERGE